MSNALVIRIEPPPVPGTPRRSRFDTLAQIHEAAVTTAFEEIETDNRRHVWKEWLLGLAYVALMPALLFGTYWMFMRLVEMIGIAAGA